jgi:nicotinate-nucleotide--dimethylbenzimidazole phosphoribosyltransferase
MGAQPTHLTPQAVEVFSDEARQAVYDVIALRRDVRHFRPDVELPDALLERILGAAHLAPSVGFSQPWGFIVIRGHEARTRIRDSFLRCREAESVRFPPERREAYLAHKLEGILEAPVNVCVAVDLRPQGEAVLGTTAQPEAVRASACCAVENLWLAARAEGIGVGWVSIVEPAVLRAELSLPPGVEPIAYLCLGAPIAFRERPMLEETGWRARRPLAEAMHADGRWDDARGPVASAPSVARARVPSRAIEPPSETARAACMVHAARLAKPVGSLGRLEEIAAWYASVRGAFPAPLLRRPVVCLFAADHGVVVEGVSAYGSQVTAGVVMNVQSGGSAINAIARQASAEIVLVDVGIAGDLSAAPTRPVVPLHGRKVRAGTANLRVAPAMSSSEATLAISVGEAIAAEAIESGADAIGLGEIGIGNTTAAAALIQVFTGAPTSALVGAGTGVAEAVRQRKLRVVEEALRRHAPRAEDPLAVLATLGGLEIAALVGCTLEAARRRIPVVLDGVVTSAAALIAVAMEPGARDYLIASHLSPEPAARMALEKLGLRPVLDLQMRLGEGTGAALSFDILRTAVSTLQSMATFATAGVVGRAGLPPDEEPRP